MYNIFQTKKMVYIKFYEVLPNEKEAIIQSYESKTTIKQPPDHDTYIRRLPNNTFDRNFYDHHMNRKSFTIPGDEGRVVVKLCEKPCDIKKGNYSTTSGYIALANYGLYDFFVDKFTVLETLLSQYSLLKSTYYLYDPDECNIC